MNFNGENFRHILLKVVNSLLYSNDKSLEIDIKLIDDNFEKSLKQNQQSLLNSEKAIEKRKATHLIGTPTMFTDIINSWVLFILIY